MKRRIPGALVGFALAVLAAACGAGPGESCRATADCKSGLRCFAPGGGADAAPVAEGLQAGLSSYLVPQTCVSQEALAEARTRAEADTSCRGLEACRESGLCRASPQGCIALLDDDCRASTVACLVQGQCVARDGVCQVGSTRDCSASEECQQRGLCALEGGVCRIVSQADCRGAEISCGYGGRCTFQEGACVATRERDCRASSGCSWSGKCSLREGVCVAASDEDCRGSGDCEEWLQCTAREGECVFAPDLSGVEEASPEEAEP